MAGYPGRDVSQMLMYRCSPRVSEGLILMSWVDEGLLQVRFIETYSVGWVSQIKHLREHLGQIFTQISHKRGHWPDSQMFGGCHTLRYCISFFFLTFLCLSSSELWTVIFIIEIFSMKIKKRMIFYSLS